MLWAITAYFNPARYRRRLTNYRMFRKHLTAPLIAVECSFGQAFELAGADADILIQIPEGDIMWQKERLLNVALGALPPECTAVAWLDCDIVFGNPQWEEDAIQALESHAIVHLFRHRYHPPPDAGPAHFDIDAHEPAAVSTAHLISTGQLEATIVGELALGHGWTNGLAWAARRDLLARHGLYDGCIIGSGDRAILAAGLGAFDAARAALETTPSHYEHYLQWAKPFYQSASGSVASLDGDLLHLWHGSVPDRRHESRNRVLRESAFDPATDIAVTAGGSWRWNSDKPDLRTGLRDYFVNRKEDGTGP